jgi:cullin-associated NEDD8-dissociated protein 1
MPRRDWAPPYEPNFEYDTAMLYWSAAPCTVKAQVNIKGWVSLVHTSSRDHSGAGPSAFPVDQDGEGDYFPVTWSGDGALFPQATAGCSGLAFCAVQGATCVCNVTVDDEAVFASLPSRSDVLGSLRVGAADPALFDAGAFVKCATAACVASEGDVVAWFKNASVGFDVDTIFELVAPRPFLVNAPRFFRNLRSMVRVPGSALSFRNPAGFMQLHEATQRDALHETEAVLDHYVNHPNVPPFVAHRVIQRFVTSNPSPRFVASVAAAFRAGRFTSARGAVFGDGRRGDLAATLAATLLDREARSPVLDRDPAFGALREPLVKFLHLLRALEFAPAAGYEVLDLAKDMNSVDLFGQAIFHAPSVFNFFPPDYQSAGAVSLAGLVSPEALLLNTPQTIAFMNGALSLIKWGLTDCDEGFGFLRGRTQVLSSTVCLPVGQLPQQPIAGALAFAPANATAGAAAVVEELNVLLAAGRLGPLTRSTLEGAYVAALAAGGGAAGALQDVEALLVATPEFNAAQANHAVPGVRAEAAANDAPLRPYKALVYFFFEGALDSWSMLVPHTGCDALRQQYEDIRGPGLALSKESLLEIATPAETSPQPCTTFGVHPSFAVVKDLFDGGDALWLANLGTLVEPVTKAELEAKTKRRPSSLFAHNHQRTTTMNVAASSTGISNAKGVIGRIMDALDSVGGGSFRTGSYSFHGQEKAVEPDTSPLPDLLSTAGLTKFDPNELRAHLAPAIANLTSTRSASVFAETWSESLGTSISRSAFLDGKLGATTLETTFPTSDVGQAFARTAEVIKNHATIGHERDAFFIKMGQFDTHADFFHDLDPKLNQINAAMAAFATEMKAQGLWDNVTVLTASDFARTLTSNGQGTDHAW